MRDVSKRSRKTKEDFPKFKFESLIQNMPPQVTRCDTCMTVDKVKNGVCGENEGIIETKMKAQKNVL